MIIVKTHVKYGRTMSPIQIILAKGHRSLDLGDLTTPLIERTIEKHRSSGIYRLAMYCS